MARWVEVETKEEFSVHNKFVLLDLDNVYILLPDDGTSKDKYSIIRFKGSDTFLRLNMPYQAAKDFILGHELNKLIVE